MAEAPKDDKAFIKAIKELRYLIVDPTSSRKSIRSLLSSYEIKPANVESVDNFPQAVDFIAAKSPHVIFCEFSLGDNDPLSLLKMQQEKLASTDVRAFLLFTSQDANAVAANAASEDVDEIVVKPFTMEILKNKFSTTMKEKISPPPFMKEFLEGKALLAKGSLDDALVKFQAAKAIDATSSLVLAAEAVCLLRMDRLEEGAQAATAGLKGDPFHFKCLEALITIKTKQGHFEEAYTLAKTLREKHSVPLKMIPDLVRLSLMAKNYDDILAFFDLADAAAKLDSSLSQYISAGLVVSGLHLLHKGETESAIQALKKAEITARGKPSILKRILIAVMAADLDEESKRLRDRLPPEILDSPEIKIAELERMEKKSAPPSEILETCIRLMREGVKIERIYVLAIQKSIEMKRKADAIDAILSDACAALPDRTDYFKSLVK